MTAIVTLFWRICLFRTGPEIIPASNFLLGLLIFLNGMVSWVASMILQAWIPVPAEITNGEAVPVEDGLVLATRVIVNLASTAALIWGLLALMGLQARLNKVLCAVFGTDILLTLLTAMAVVLALSIHPTLWQVVSLSMFFWTVGTIGFILHRGMDISFGFGIAAALFVLTFSFAIGQVVVT